MQRNKKVSNISPDCEKNPIDVAEQDLLKISNTTHSAKEAAPGKDKLNLPMDQFKTKYAAQIDSPLRTRQLHETLHTVLEDGKRSPANKRPEPYGNIPALSNTQVVFSDVNSKPEFQGIADIGE